MSVTFTPLQLSGLEALSHSRQLTVNEQLDLNKLTKNQLQYLMRRPLEDKYQMPMSNFLNSVKKYKIFNVWDQLWKHCNFQDELFYTKLDREYEMLLFAHNHAVRYFDFSLSNPSRKKTIFLDFLEDRPEYKSFCDDRGKKMTLRGGDKCQFGQRLDLILKIIFQEELAYTMAVNLSESVPSHFRNACVEILLSTHPHLSCNFMSVVSVTFKLKIAELPPFVAPIAQSVPPPTAVDPTSPAGVSIGSHGKHSKATKSSKSQGNSSSSTVADVNEETMVTKRILEDTPNVERKKARVDSGTVAMDDATMHHADENTINSDEFEHFKRLLLKYDERTAVLLNQKDDEICRLTAQVAELKNQLVGWNDRRDESAKKAAVTATDEPDRRMGGDDMTRRSVLSSEELNGADKSVVIQPEKVLSPGVACNASRIAVDVPKIGVHDSELLGWSIVIQNLSTGSMLNYEYYL